MIQRIGMVLAAVCLLLAASHTEAQDDPEADARHAFEAGRSAFEHGRYEEALGLFERAHDLSKRPALLYNMAKCHEAMDRDEEALALFERYLLEQPDPPNREQVEARVLALRRSLSTKSASPEPGPESGPAPTDTDVHPFRGKWNVLQVSGVAGMGVGLATLVGGAVFGARALALADESKQDCDGNVCGPDGFRDRNDARASGNVATGLFIAGGVLVGAGVTLFWLGVRKKHDASIAVQVAPFNLRLSSRF